jgi:uncharacterized Zn finger protein/superfamily II DNA or RNA helicase
MAKRIQYGNTPWGATWIQALEEGGAHSAVSGDGRLARGRTYANTGRVRDIEVVGSTVRGKVQGSETRPYTVTVEVRPFTPVQKSMLFSFIEANPSIVADLTRGVIPEWFLGWLWEKRLPIAPASWNEMSGDCSCPDWGSPCKHQVAVFYALANDIDRTPLLLFHLRGVTTRELLEAAGSVDQPDLMPTLPMPKFIPFAKATRAAPPEIWRKDWLPRLENKAVKKITAALPSKPRFNTAQEDLRDFLEVFYSTMAQNIPENRTEGKKPSAMPNIWLEFIPESHLWEAHFTIPDGNNVFSKIAYKYGDSLNRLPAWNNNTIIAKKQLVASCALGELVNACSQTAGFSTLKHHTPSSQFFCAALDAAYMLAATHSFKPILVRNSPPQSPPGTNRQGQKRNAPQRTGVLPPRRFGRGAQPMPRSIGAPAQKAQYFIRYEPFVQSVAEKEALAEIIATLRALLPPEMVIAGTSDAVMSPKSLEHLFSDILTEVIHLTMAPVSDAYYFRGQLQQSFLKPLPLASGMTPVKFLANELYDWLSWLDVAGMDITPILRIEEPTDEEFVINPDTPFKLYCDVQDRSNPLAQPIPLRQVLNAKDKVFGQEAEKIQTLVMRVLDDAAKLFPALQWALDARNSERGAPIELPLSEIYDFLTETAQRLRDLGVSLVLPQALANLVRPRARVKAKGKEGESFITMLDLVEFDYDIAIGDESISIADFKRLLRRANGLMRFRNTYVMLSPTEAKSLLQKLAVGVKLDAHGILKAALVGEEDGFIFDGDEAFKRAFKTLTDVEDITLPTNINATLRPYQERGFQWMYSTMERGFGVILADDMGLGKTLQALALLQRLKLDGKLPHHALIVCPTTLVTNWLRECNRFTPDLVASIYHGSDRTFDFEGSDLVITTYGILRREAKQFAAHAWSIIVVDEAQNMKNHDAAQTKAVKTIPAPMRLALSGTPVENRLSELWSLFDWLNKGYLHGITRFRDDFAKPIEREHDAETIHRLRTITAPFILRRLKSDKSIIADLPDKIITNEYCTLTKEQAAIYENEVQRALAVIEGKDENDTIARSGLIFSMMTALKQICNHPVHYAKKGDAHSKDSGKSARLMELLDSIQESDEKALIFTQYKEMGTLLEQMIADELNADALFFHGGVSRKNRDKLVETFQNDPSVRYMIVSLKAGGTGLNLTAATNVIHYDLWWNPAVENQATDRAYRIGQMHNVQVHRFITQATFEEKIDAMIQAKQELANLTVGTGENWITDLSNTELREIFTLAR